MFEYDPKDASNAWPAGEYDATVLAVEQTVSKTTKNPMLKVTFEAHKGDGAKQQIFEYIVNPSTIFKLKQIAVAFGKSDDFARGKFDLSKYQNRRLKLKLKVQSDDQFGDKNVVDKYLPAPASSAKPQPAAAGAGVAGELPDSGGPAADDIPF